MIESQAAWKAIIINAQKALTTNMVYHSIVKDRAYRVISVEGDKLFIDRVSGGDTDELTRSTVFRAIDKFNKSNGRVRRRTLISPTVAKETALVLFCPFLTWDKDGEYIIEV